MPRKQKKPIIFPSPKVTVLTKYVTPRRPTTRKGEAPPPPQPPVESPNDLRSEQFVKLVDAISEGVIGGLVDGLRSVYVDGTPVENADGSVNFSGVSIETRSGTPDQPPLDGFPTAEVELAVQTYILHDTPLTKSVLSPDVDAIRVTMSVPQLMENNTVTGDIMPCQVNYTIEYRPNGGGWAMAVNEYLNGKTSTKYQRSHYIKLTGSAPWDIRVTRVTPDPTSSAVHNQIMWDTYTEITETRLTYPSTALIGVRASAQQFPSIPARRYHVDGIYIKVPSNYDPETAAYEGAWDGTFKLAVSSNPAWIFYDVVTNKRYGLGEYVTEDQVDKWALYEIAQYCDVMVTDGKGGVERRFSCNITIADGQEAFTLINNLASIFRGMAYWSSGTVVPSADKPADVTAIFSNANVIDGAFNYQGSDRRARHTVCLVSWYDPVLLGESRIAYVEDRAGVAKWGVQQTEIEAFGCTSEAQAIRMGRWLLYTEHLETEVVGFSVSLASSWVYPNAVIQIADASRSGERTGGRVVSVDPDTQAITLDSPISRDTELLTISVEDDGIVVAPIKQFIDDYTVQVFSSKLPEPNSLWIGSRENLNPTTWRVLSVAEGEDGILEVSALAHNPSKYEYIEKNIDLENPPTTVVPNKPPYVEDLNLQEFLVYGEGSTFNIRGLLSWFSNETLFVVRWRQYDGIWQTKQTAITSIELDLEEGAWEFEVTAVNMLGVYSDPVLLQQQVLGKDAPPTNVSEVKAAVLPDNIFINWSLVPDIDLDVYEIRAGEDWDTATVLGEAKVNYFYASPMKAGSTTIQVRARDYDGKYSAISATTIVVVAAPRAPSVSGELIGGELILNWTDAPSDHRAERYEIWREVEAGVANARQYKRRTIKNKISKHTRRINQKNSNLEYVATVGGLYYRFLVEWGGARVFHVRAIDVAGNTGEDGITTVVINTPTQPVPRSQVIDNNVMLRWSVDDSSRGTRLLETRSTQGRLPVNYYIVKSAQILDPLNPPIVDQATEFGRVSGEFCMVYENAGGLYRYFVQAVDTAGNTSEQGTIDAVVDQPPDYNLWTEITSTLDEAGAWNGNALRAFNGWVAPIAADISWSSHFVTNDWETITDQLQTEYKLYKQPTLGGGESWAEHFESHNWLTPKDHVDAGYPIYLQPTSGDGARYEHIFDYGTTLPSIQLDVTVDLVQKIGNSGYKLTISTRAETTDPWVDSVADSIVVPENTRYIKIRIDITSDGDPHSYCLVRSMLMTLAAKFKTDQGDVFVPAEGATVKFLQPFVDVINVVATAKGTDAIYCATDFQDIPYPQSFKIYAFDSKGDPVATQVTWTARGF